MRALFIFLATIASFCFLIYILALTALDMQKDHEETYENMVGKKILLDKDSITIIDYSILHETYTLSNGKTVSVKLIKK